VASVPGGVELLLAAGYILDTTTEDPSLQSTRSEKISIMSNDEDTSKEGFLVHSMDPVSERKLVYTLSRLQELMDMQSKV
jgi:hypothetical protein